MLSQQELTALLSDLESDRVERTISVKDTDKFSKAVCAFSNDYPNHKLPGYLIVGADDKTGKVAGLTISDELLKDLAAIRNPGGLYGSARPENFPDQNDYRNPIVAEALKIMEYVNKFNRGIATAQAELNANGNPPAEFIYNLPLRFSVTIYKKR
jgi:predicted HTH transcriptional regulator